MKSLLILSSFGHASYGGYGQREAFWRDLQQRFIASTTDDYDYAVYLNRVDRGLFPSALIVGENNRPRTSLETQITLKSLLEYARSRPYAHYLILDSDAFPVRRGWVELLVNKMGECRFAAPVRYENLDTFPHPSALFIKGEAIGDDFDFAPSFAYQDLLRQPVLDVGTAIKRDRCFPLVRTNRINVHPILAGLYYDVFYHHGGGSRRAFLRSIFQGYYDHLVGDEETAEKRTFAELDQDPEGFINRLRGMSPPSSVPIGSEGPGHQQHPGGQG